MKKIITFLKEWQGESIEIEQLAKITESNYDEVEHFLLNSSHWPEEISDKIKPVIAYFSKTGTKVEHPGFLEKKDLDRKIETVINRQYCTEEKSLELFLAKYLFGHTPYFGLIDTSDIGGLYHYAWLIASYEELPKYLQEDSGALLNQLNPNSAEITYKNNTFEVTLEKDSFTTQSKANSLPLAIARAIRDLISKNQASYIIDAYHDESTEAEFKEPGKQIFLSRADAEKELLELSKNSSINFKIREIKI